MIPLLLLLLLPVCKKAPPCQADTAVCCRVCVEGMACGDTCIVATDECSAPPGCACNLSDLCPEG